MIQRMSFFGNNDDINRIFEHGWIFRTGKDFFLEKLGPALENNKEEVERITNYVENIGGKVEWTDRKVMVYGPGSKDEFGNGTAGTIIINKEASYGALLHEFEHFLDDEKSGWKGYNNVYGAEDVSKAYWEYEMRGYEAEIKLAQKLGFADILIEIKEEMEERRKDIYDKFS